MRRGRRILSKFLVGRPARWLSLWIWLPAVPLGTMIIYGALLSMSLGSSSGGGLGYRAYYDGSRIVHGPDAEQHRAIWIDVRLSREWTPLSWTAAASFEVRDASTRTPLTDRVLVDAARRSALERFDLEYSASSRRDEEDELPAAYHEWVRATWRATIADERSPSVTSIVPSRLMLASWYALHAGKWFIWIGAALALACWLARTFRVSRSRRMVRRHERGLCPDCLYELPDRAGGVCPECGHDHVARYLAARGVIDEVEQTRFQWKRAWGGVAKE